MAQTISAQSLGGSARAWIRQPELRGQRADRWGIIDPCAQASAYAAATVSLCSLTLIAVPLMIDPAHPAAPYLKFMPRWNHGAFSLIPHVEKTDTDQSLSEPVQ